MLNCGCRTNGFVWVSHKHKAVYFENPKAGSSSIKKALNIEPPNLRCVLIQLYFEWREIKRLQLIIRDYYNSINANQLACLLQETNEIISDLKDQAQSHITVHTSNTKNVPFEHFLGRPEDVLNLFPDYYRFAFVRDPLDRFLSNYRMFGQQPSRITQIHELTRTNMVMDKIDDFITLIQQHRNHHWDLQHKYLPIRNTRLHIDFLGKTDSFCEDWKELCKRIGVNQDIGLINVTNRPSGLSAQLSQNQIRTIHKIYEQDLQIIDF